MKIIMNRACFVKDTNTDEQCHASYVRPSTTSFAWMRKGLMTVCLSLACYFGSAQSSVNVIWGKQYGCDKEVYVRNHMIDRFGNVFVTGYTDGKMGERSFGKKDGFVSKIDGKGNLLWSSQFGSDQDDDIQGSAMDDAGNIYITGTTDGVLGEKKFGKEDIFVAKFSSKGKQLWIKQFGTDSVDIGLGILVSKDQSVYVTGSTFGKLGSTSQGNEDAFVMKLTPGGRLVYVQQFGTSLRDGGDCLAQDNAGRIYLAGRTFGNMNSSNKGMMDCFICRLDEQGKPITFAQLGTESFDVPTCLMVDNQDNVYLGGTTAGNLASSQLGEGDCFLVKLNRKGEILWNKQFGTDKHDSVKGICSSKLLGDNFLVSGVMNLPHANAFVRMYSGDGKLIWEKKIIPEGVKGDASGKNVTIDRLGNIYHVGLTGFDLYGRLSGTHDFYLVKLK